MKNLKALLLIAVMLLPLGAFADAFTAYVGYADLSHAKDPAPGTFPDPWLFSDQVQWIFGDCALFDTSCSDPLALPDAGAIRIDNTSGSTITLNEVDVLNSNGDLWIFNGFDTPLDPGMTAIFTDQDAVSESFDTSDFGFLPLGSTPAPNATAPCAQSVVNFNGSNTQTGDPSNPCPVVVVRINGQNHVYYDIHHILDTGGTDRGFDGSNESQNWDQLHNNDSQVPEPGSLVLLGTGIAGLARRMRKGKK